MRATPACVFVNVFVFLDVFMSQGLKLRGVIVGCCGLTDSEVSANQHDSIDEVMGHNAAPEIVSCRNQFREAPTCIHL